MNKRQMFGILAWITFVCGIAFILNVEWVNLLDPLIFNNAGKIRTDGAFQIFAPFLYHLKHLFYDNDHLGLPLLFLGLLVGILAKQPSTVNGSYFQKNRIGFAAISVAAFAHFLVILFSMPLFRASKGASIRPMSWAYMITILAFWTFIFVIPTGGVAIKKERPRIVGVIAIVLGLTPYVFALFVLACVVMAKGLYLSD